MVMLFLGMGEVNAQESSSVMITTYIAGRKITLQVVDDQNNTTVENFKYSEEIPEQAILKMEMDKWVKKGYNITQSYGYAATSGAGGAVSSARYETIILTKQE